MVGRRAVLAGHTGDVAAPMLAVGNAGIYRQLLRVALATAALALVAWLALRGLATVLPRRGIGSQLALALGPIGAGGAAYLAAARVLRIPELDELVRGARENLERAHARAEQALTQRKELEEAMRRERDFAEGLIDTAQAIVIVLDRDGRFLRFNHFMEELSGYARSELQNADWFAIFPPEPERNGAQGAAGGFVPRCRVSPGPGLPSSINCAGHSSTDAYPPDPMSRARQSEALHNTLRMLPAPWVSALSGTQRTLPPQNAASPAI